MRREGGREQGGRGGRVGREGGMGFLGGAYPVAFFLGERSEWL